MFIMSAMISASKYTLVLSKVKQARMRLGRHRITDVVKHCLDAILHIGKNSHSFLA